MRAASSLVDSFSCASALRRGRPSDRGPSASWVALLSAGFVLTGFVTVLLGPVLPALSLRWGLNDRAAGYFFTAQFLGAMLSTVLSGPMLAHFGYRRLLIAGYLLMGLGAGFFLRCGYATAVGCVAVFGAGQGVAATASNLLVSTADSRRRASLLNLVNAAWAAGAVASPLLVALAIHSHRLPTALCALLPVAVLLVFLCILLEPPPSPAQVRSRQSLAVDARSFTVVVLMNLLYVGAENATGGWLASWAKALSPQAALWSLVPAVFWGLLMLGRFLSALLLRFVSLRRLLSAAFLTAFTGLGVLQLSRSMLHVLVAAAICGLGFSALFPAIVDALRVRLGSATEQYGGIAFAIGPVGGALLPLAVGVISSGSGSLRHGLLIPLAALLPLPLLLLSRENLS